MPPRLPRSKPADRGGPVQAAGPARRDREGALTPAVPAGLALAWLGFGCFGALALALALSLALGPSPAAAQSEPPPRRGSLAIDSRQSIDRGALATAIGARIEEPFGLEALMIVVDECGPDPELFLDEALIAYALAPRPGEMVDDAIAWLICAEPPEARFARSINNRYGTYLDPETIELAMRAALEAVEPEAGEPGTVESGAVESEAVEPEAGEPGAGDLEPSDQGAGGSDTGNLEAAAAAGIDAAADLLESAPRSRPRPEPGSEAAASAPSARPDGRDLAIAAVILALAGLVWQRRRRGAARERGAAPKDVKRLRAVASDVAERVLGDSPSLSQLVAACEPLGEPARMALLRRHEAMSRRVTELLRQVEALEGRYAIRPDGGDDPQARAAERRRLEDLLVEADALSGYADRLDRELRHAGDLHERAERFIDEARADVLSAREAYARAAAPLADDPSFRLPDAFAATTFAEARIAAALRALSEGRRLQAGRRAEDASEIATRAARAAGAIARGARRLEAARGRFHAFAHHAEASWWDVRGHGAEAEESLMLAVELLRALIEAPEAALGDDPAAGFVANIARIDAEVERAIGLCDVLEARLADVERARAQVEAAQGPIRDAVAAVIGGEAEGGDGAATAARQPVDLERDRPAGTSAATAKPGADAASHAVTARATSAAAEARAALVARPPDWIAARHALVVAARSAEEAESAGAGAGGGGAGGTSPTGRIGRFGEIRTGPRTVRRHTLELAEGDATAEVERAERFVQAHGGEIGPRAVRRVEEARAALDRALEARRRAEGHEAEKAGDEALAALRVAGEIAGDGLRRLREAFERLEEPLPVVSRRAGAGSLQPIPVVARRSPFAARFGDWGDVRPAAPLARKGRWGARKAEGAGAEPAPPGW